MDQLAIQKTTSLDGPARVREITLIYILTVTALYVFFAADLANKILIYFHIDFQRISVIFRSLYELAFFALILVFPNKARTTFLTILLFAFITFIIGQLVFASNVTFPVSYMENILIFNKYFFVFIIYYGIYKLQDHPGHFSRAIRVMERLFILNAWLTLIGVIFGIEVFRTYVLQSYRFGYSGILWVQNEATIMCFLAISYFYYKHFILGQKSRQFLVVLVASMFLGTKSIYLFMVLLLLFHFFSHSSLKAKVAVLFLSACIYFFVYWFLQTETADKLLAYFVSKADRMGIWYMLFSGRVSYLAVVNDQILQYWTFVNYIVGGQDQIKFMIEMDFFDLFLFLGIVGFIVYFLLLFTTVFRFSLKKPFNLFFVFSFMLLAFLSGHFFSSVINAVYLVLICLFFYVNSKRSSTLNEENTAHQ
jgi:hypothetical protein